MESINNVSMVCERSIALELVLGDSKFLGSRDHSDVGGPPQPSWNAGDEVEVE